MPDEPREVRARVLGFLEQGAQVVITNGGTGIGARDSTYEAVTALLDKRLDGFGELFRFLSWEQVGAAAMLSRAVAGTARGGVVIALPGSTPAVELALDKLVLPEARTPGLSSGHTRAGHGAHRPSRPCTCASCASGTISRASRHGPRIGSPSLQWSSSTTASGPSSPNLLSEAPPSDIPGFGSGAQPPYAELAVLSGQLAAAAEAATRNRAQMGRGQQGGAQS